MRRGRPAPLEGALVLPKHRMFARIARTLRFAASCSSSYVTGLDRLAEDHLLDHDVLQLCEVRRYEEFVRGMWSVNVLFLATREQATALA
jgi:hypothetical protein